MFALKVAQEDEELRLRRYREEIWRRHLEYCRSLGLDPAVCHNFRIYYFVLVSLSDLFQLLLLSFLSFLILGYFSFEFLKGSKLGEINNNS